MVEKAKHGFVNSTSLQSDCDLVARLPALALQNRHSRVAGEAVGFGPRAAAQGEHGPAGVAHDLLVGARVAQAGAGRPALDTLYSIHIPEATRACTSLGPSCAAIASRSASSSSSRLATSRDGTP